MFYKICCRMLLLACLFCFVFPLAAQQANKALAQQAHIYQKKATYYSDFDMADSAMIFFEKAAALYKNSDPVAYARVQQELVMLLNNAGATEAAYKLLRANRGYIRKHIGDNSQSLIRYYLVASKFHIEQKNHQTNNIYLHKALNKSRELYGNGSAEEANILRLISVRMNDADSAFVTSEKALKILHNNKHCIETGIAVLIFNSVGVNLLNLSYYNGNVPVKVAGKKFESTLHAAMAFFDSSYHLEVSRYNQVTPFAASVLHNIGICYESLVYEDPSAEITPFKINNWKKALEYYDLSNQYGLEKGYSVVPLNMVCKGIVYADMGDPGKALYWYHQGLKANIKNFTSDNIYDLPEIDALQLNEISSILLEYKANAFRDSYAETGKLKDLDAFYKHALKLAETLERMRENSKLYHESKDGPAINLMSENYALAIEACQMLYQKTGNKKYIREGFAIAEKFKNNSLLNISQKQKLMQYLKGNEQALVTYKKLSGSVKYYDELVKLTKDNAVFKNVALFKNAEDSLAFYESRFNTFIADIKIKYPGFYEEKIENAYAATLPELQEMLPNNNTAAVIYVRHYAQREVKPNLYAFVVEKNQAHFLKIELPDFFDAKTDSLIQVIFKSDLPGYKLAALDMYQLIFDPISQKLSKNVDELLVMPDGKLWQIPFSALLVKQSESEDYRDLPYLINRFSVQYAHTATLLKNYTAKSSALFHQDNVLAMAPFADQQLLGSLLKKKEINLMGAGKQKQKYNSLPFTTKLLYKLQNQLPGKFLMDSAATEHYFKQNAARFSVLHIATHAETDLNDPLNSKLILAKTDNEDGELRMDELFQLNLKPELAVLSACETGVGVIKAGGEGMLSLAWIFNYLGCPSTISSLWKVDDRNTSLLLEKFYDHLADGKPKDDALHLAKMEMMQQARTSAEANPFYWSAFVLVGDPAPLQLSPVPYITSLVLGGFALLLLAVAAFFYRLRKIRSKNALQPSEKML